MRQSWSSCQTCASCLKIAATPQFKEGLPQFLRSQLFHANPQVVAQHTVVQGSIVSKGWLNRSVYYFDSALTLFKLHNLHVTSFAFLMQFNRLHSRMVPVDRGGLFEVNDTAYLLFRIIELRVRKHLLISFSKGSTLDEINKREVIASAVAADDDVQFYWTLLSVDITNEQIAIDLLKEMIGMWITIRGFSIAKAWLEKYMPEKKSKQKALRKELKIISTPSECT